MVCLAAMRLIVNGESHELTVAPDTPLLWVLRDVLNLTGTKYGCGLGLCGACTVHLNGEAVRACQTSLGSIGDKRITTIEGLTQAGRLNCVQRAWIEEQVPQCGYCQSGQIMQATALLTKKPNVTNDDINSAMAGNLCRCATYFRIRKAIHRASQEVQS